MNDGGQWPAELTTIALLDRMRATWPELQATPAVLVLDYLMDMRAQGEAQATRKRWDERGG